MRALCVIALVVIAGIVPASASAAYDEGKAFDSPTGNILCVGYHAPAQVACLVIHSAWPHRPPEPKSCDWDWLPEEITLSSTRLELGSCRSDSNPYCGTKTCVLPYRSTIAFGSIRCRSARNGITCRDTKGRHLGFRIAYEGFKLWR
jgi:hypothetical protein